MQKYLEKTKESAPEIYNELLPYSKGARCTFPGWKCTAPCVFGAKDAMKRKIQKLKEKKDVKYNSSKSKK